MDSKSKDVFRAVIAVETQDDEGEALPQHLEHREQESFADALACGHSFVLRHAVYGIDVIEAFGIIQIALADAVHAQITGLVVRRRRPSLAGGNGNGSGLGPSSALTLIVGLLA